MSALSQFATAQFVSARALIGGEDITVNGGTAISAVLNEIENSREYDAGGFEPGTTLRAVVLKSAWDSAYPLAAQAYLGKSATARSQTFTVSRISSGVGFVEIDFVDEEAAR